MSHNISESPKTPKCCPPFFPTIKELEELIAKYRAMLAAAKASHDKWEEKAASLDDVAKQGDDPTATNTAIKQAIEQGAEKLAPTAEVDGSKVKFYYVTLDQMLKVYIGTDAGTVRFELTQEENTFCLRFSNDSPSSIAGQIAYDDAWAVRNDVFDEIAINLSGMTIEHILMDGIYPDLRNTDITWRIDDLQRSAANAETILGKLFTNKTFEYLAGDADLLKAVKWTYHGKTRYAIAAGEPVMIGEDAYSIIHTYAYSGTMTVIEIDEYHAIDLDEMQIKEGCDVYAYDPATGTIGSLKGTVSEVHDIHLPSDVASETNATLNKRDIKGADSTKVFDCGASIPACSFDDGSYWDIYLDSDKYWFDGASETEFPDVDYGDMLGVVVKATEVDAEAGLLLCTSFTSPFPLTLGNVNKSGDNYYLNVSGGATFVPIEAGKNYRCKEVIDLQYINRQSPFSPAITGYLYLWEEYEGCSIHDAKEEIIGALDNIDLSGVAQQGSDPSVNITDMDAKLGDVESALEYIEGGGLPSIATIAKQGSDANANISDIESAIGTPGTGQPSTLFAAIAAGGGGGGETITYPTIQMTATTASIDANKVYIWGEVASLDITLNAGEAGVANVYFLEFYSGATPTTLTLPASVTDIRGSIAANAIINVAILNGVAYIA